MKAKTHKQTDEYNFDGLIGPTHNYAGLSYGNKASIKHKHQVSHPQSAALEGLEKAKFLMDQGFKQGLLPPHERPDFSIFKKLGFSEKKPETWLKAIYKLSPAWLASCYSASAMWTANSATFSPSADTQDGKAHWTPANLISFPHRALETQQTSHILKTIFADSRYFTHHPPLPSLSFLSDEGAANHNRLTRSYGQAGVELFVYGRRGFEEPTVSKKVFARQSQLAGQLIAFRHKLHPQKTVLAQQNPLAIVAGVFHNDVICVADQNLIFYHEKAFTNSKAVLAELKKKLWPTPLIEIKVKARDLSLKEVVSSYLFNSQLLPLKKDQWALVAPDECRQNPRVWDYIKDLNNKSSVITATHFIPIRQSMQNGGGPACLRLRVVLTHKEAKSVHKGVILTPSLYKQLKAWIKKHYRDRLSPKDLLDPLLVEEGRVALEELTQLLGLGNIYPFQLR